MVEFLITCAIFKELTALDSDVSVKCSQRVALALGPTSENVFRCK